VSTKTFESRDLNTVGNLVRWGVLVAQNALQELGKLVIGGATVKATVLD
jgi:hypothetical protein